MLALLLVQACGREVVFVDPPPPSSSDIDTTGTDTTGTDTTGTDTTVVQRADLRVTVTIAAVDTALATRLGLANGRLSNAQVTARRVAGQQGPQTGTTDSLGQVTLPQLIEGVWAIAAGRSLTEAERALLDSANADVTGFGGAGQLNVAAPAPALTIEAPAGRRGDLVISEAHVPVDNQNTGYRWAQYVEVHNNAFGTIYLDGTVIGQTIAFVRDVGTFDCAASAPWREDPAGIWSRQFWAFPGTGSTFPLPPGASVIVATDAIDHRLIDSGFLDLSDANFEFIGTNDVDNPAVPNMLNIPPFTPNAGDPVGHGPTWVIQVGLFLSQPVNVDSLPRDNLPVQNPLYVRFPREKILDVVTSERIPAQQSSPICNFVHPSFDARFAELIDGSLLGYSLFRFPVLDDVLQRTKTSATDFGHGPPTPGRVR